MKNKSQQIIFEKSSVESLWIYFRIFGMHGAGVELCNRANNDDTAAMVYARKIWNKDVQTPNL